MICPNCGRTIYDGESSCVYCGTDLRALLQSDYNRNHNVRYNSAQPPKKVRTVADKVVMVLLMLLTVFNAVIPLFEWVKITIIEKYPLLKDVPFVPDAIKNSESGNIFKFIQLLEDFQKTTGAQINSVVQKYDILNLFKDNLKDINEQVAQIVILLKVFAGGIIASMVFAGVMIILALCFKYKAACVFSFISAAFMFASSLGFYYVMSGIPAEKGLTGLTSWPVYSMILSVVLVFVTVIALVIVSRAKKKRLSANNYY